MSVDEDEPVGFNVEQVISTDSDDGDDGEIFYSMASNANFELNSVSGRYYECFSWPLLSIN